MLTRTLAGALALATLVVPSVALADDPSDPAMRSKAARAADKAEIRRLNKEQYAYVRERDARYQEGWQAYREYPKQKAEYEKRMAEWRHAVKMCESGHHEYCAH